MSNTASKTTATRSILDLADAEAREYALQCGLGGLLVGPARLAEIRSDYWATVSVLRRPDNGHYVGQINISKTWGIDEPCEFDLFLRGF